MSHASLLASAVAEASKAAVERMEKLAQGGSYGYGEQLQRANNLLKLATAVATGEIRPAFVTVSAEDFAIIAEHYR